jgi:hypothetical protein
VTDQAAHVFARNEGGWVDLFAAHGLSLVQRRRYDYDPVSRSLPRIMRAFRTQNGTAINGAPTPRLFSPARQTRVGSSRGVVAKGTAVARTVARGIDLCVEPVLIRRQPALGSGHAGMLFRKSQQSQP